MNCDVLAFGAHPDDIELLCGGTVIKIVRLGYNVGIVDLTEGEMGTRGSVARRYEESSAAMEIMGVKVRENLQIPDCGIEHTQQNLNKIIGMIRTHRPKIVLSPNFEDRHPDHIRTAKLVHEAAFYSGVMKVLPRQPAFRPDVVLQYSGYYDFEPSFVVDITDDFEKKMEAVRAYKSQVYNPEATDEPETFISSKVFMDFIENKARYWGNRIKRTYGEPFKLRETLEVFDPVNYFSRIQW